MHHLIQMQICRSSKNQKDKAEACTVACCSGSLTFGASGSTSGLQMLRGAFQVRQTCGSIELSSGWQAACMPCPACAPRQPIPLAPCLLSSGITEHQQSSHPICNFIKQDLAELSKSMAHCSCSTELSLAEQRIGVCIRSCLSSAVLTVPSRAPILECQTSYQSM